MQTIRIGTRGSKLALYQAYRVKEELEVHFSEIGFEIVIIKTKGDKILDIPLSKIGDKGLFTKEIETAMFNHEIDMAIHSLKDLPTIFPEGVRLGAVLKRGDVRDAVISSNNRKIKDLTPDDVIATSSLRRKAQLLRINKDFNIIEIRGNVNTRVRKMQEGYCDVMVMAAAGLQRLGMENLISEFIDPLVVIPACSQGAIAIEIRENDPFIEEMLSIINDRETMIATTAERAFLRRLEGGCQIPVGSYSCIQGDQFHITGFISSIDGSNFIKESASAHIEKAVETAVSLAETLYMNGGKDILESIRISNLIKPEKMTLSDKIIVSTRATGSGDSLPDLLTARGAKVLSLPMINIVPSRLNKFSQEILENIEMFDWIFFSSKNGVANFFRLLIETKGNTELPKALKKAVIGQKTAFELDYYGYVADYISPGNTSEDLLDQFYKAYNSKNQRILLSLGNLADDTLINRLSKENDVKRINVYHTEKPESADDEVLELIRQDKYDLIVFTSPSTFQNFCSFYEYDKIKFLKMASIGTTTSSAIEDAGFTPVVTAKKSSTEGLTEAITEYFKNN